MKRRLVIASAALAAVAAAVVVFSATRSGDAPAGDPRAFCERVTEFQRAVDTLGQGPESADQVQAAHDAAAEVIDAAEGLSRVAPEEIASDVREMVDASVAVVRQLRDFYAGVLADPDLAQDARYLASFEISHGDQARADQAAARVRPWIAQHCGASAQSTTTRPD